MARGKRLEVIKHDISENMCYAEVTCKLNCGISEFCEYVFNTQGVTEYLLGAREHSLGLWHRCKQSEVEAGVSLGGREYMFPLGRKVGEEFLIIFLDCRYKQVRLCLVPEVISAFIKAFNGEIKTPNLLSVARGITKVQ